MGRVVSREMIIYTTDNGNVYENRIPNINPAITDTSVLKTAAIQLKALTSDTMAKIEVVETLDITND